MRGPSIMLFRDPHDIKVVMDLFVFYHTFDYSIPLSPFPGKIPGLYQFPKKSMTMQKPLE